MEQETRAGGEIRMTDEAVAALIRKIAEGDRSALIGLYDRTSRLLFGTAFKILGDRTSAEEALLDVYTTIWRQSGSYNPKLFTPLEWLMTVARTQAIACLHWSKQDKRKRKPPEGAMDPNMTVAPERQRIARASIASLVPTQQEILELAYYSGLSCSDIAAQIGKPLGAVRTHARLALGKLDDLFRQFSKPEAKPQ